MATPPPLPVRRLPVVLKVLIGFFVLGLLLATLIGLHVYHRGYVAWKTVEDDLKSRGETLYLPDLAPPPIPDDQNFFADPIWEMDTSEPESKRTVLSAQIPALTPEENERFSKRYPTVSWTPNTQRRLSALQNLWKEKGATPGSLEAVSLITLDALEPLAPIFEKLDTLLQRSGARYPAVYKDAYAMASPHAVALFEIAQLLFLQAKAHIALGNTDQAVRDISRIYRLQRTMVEEPTLITLLTRSVMISLAQEVTFYGLWTPAWSDSQLKKLASMAEEADLLSQLPRVVRGERASLNMELDKALLPRGSYGEQKNRARAVAWLFLREDRAQTNLLYQDFLDALENPVLAGYPRNTAIIKRLEEHLRRPLGNARFFYMRLALPVPLNSEFRLLHTEVNTLQLQAACALERYNLQHGRYPDSLNTLVPDFLPSVPPDLIDNQPLRYRLNDSGKYLLYSIGSDRIDDDGTPGSLRDGDWPFGTPLKKTITTQ